MIFKYFVIGLRTALLVSGLDQDYSDTVFEKMIDYYERRATFEESIIDIMNDSCFLIATLDLSKAAAQRKETKSWFLLFDHYPSFFRNLPQKGMVHGLDVPYLMDYDIEYLGKLMGLPLSGKLEGEELQVKLDFIALVGDFVRTG